LLVALDGDLQVTAPSHRCDHRPNGAIGDAEAIGDLLLGKSRCASSWVYVLANRNGDRSGSVA